MATRVYLEFRESVQGLELKIWGSEFRAKCLGFYGFGTLFGPVVVIAISAP